MPPRLHLSPHTTPSVFAPHTHASLSLPTLTHRQFSPLTLTPHASLSLLTLTPWQIVADLVKYDRLLTDRDGISKIQRNTQVKSSNCLKIGGIVALGKFDALHIGHRELAIQASKVGAPFLLSFVGMAEVLGWEPRAPIVAKCDRERVLSSWASFCGNVAPKEFLIDFAGVRHLSPRQFVEKLSNELGVRGVVAGENYRFGYKAAGDASELVRLCEEYGMQAYIINSVMDKNQNLDILCASGKKERGQVSSTRVRYALSLGDMNYVSELLGREYRLILSTQNKEEIIGDKNRVSAPKSCLLNLPPNEGLYENCSLVIGENNQLQCRVLIDSTHIYLEPDDKDHRIYDASQEFLHLGIEFKGQGS